MIEFTLNGALVSTDESPDTPLLWAVRDTFKLKGSKYGCGAGLCGACTMHVDGQAVRTCVLPLAAVAGREVTTIEGLGTPDALHAVQEAWVEHQVAQCGYCQSGQIMQAATLLASNANPSDDDIVSHMNGNLCRCMSYVRIKRAIKRAAGASDGVVAIYDPRGEVQS